MEANGPPRAAKQLWRIVRAVYYMMLKGISKHNVMLELHLLFKRGKLASKAISGILTHHHHYHTSLSGSSYAAALSCRSMDPAAAVYVPREVEFSCSNTPSFPFLYLSKRKNHHHHYNNHLHQHFPRRHRHRSRHDDSFYEYDAAAIAKVFEVLNDSESTTSVEDSLAASPVAVRHVRITDSPFPVTEEEEEVEVDGGVDRKAEEFIKWFYEQQRLQQQRRATPEMRYWD